MDISINLVESIKQEQSVYYQPDFGGFAIVCNLFFHTISVLELSLLKVLFVECAFQDLW